MILIKTKFTNKCPQFVNFLTRHHRLLTTPTTSSKNEIKYTSTINLPKTKFPLRLGAAKRQELELKILTLCFKDLYEWQCGNLAEPEFVLHDGPPYANGDLHMGHAINKILKDIILRHHISQGRKVNYTPGWDCHGLPIELKASQKGNQEPTVIRKSARKFAEESLKKQKEEFCQWGVVGSWEKSNTTYRTIDPKYIISEIRIFQELYKKGLVYRVLKPVHWSPSSRTALAEAELEYDNNFKSPSVYLRLKVAQISDTIRAICNEQLYALIWTTTPWTLPSNQAVCFNPQLNYSVVRFINQPGAFIIASDLEINIRETIGDFEVLGGFQGDTLAGTTYSHPFSDERLPFLPARHVQSTKGTGLVHTAPAHGPDDFLTSIEHNIKVRCLVDENGDYTKEAPQFLQGKNVLRDGNSLVIAELGHDIIKEDTFQHAYPIDWRTKEPVIFRASQQWFIDTEKIKSQAAKCIENEIEFYPKVAADANKKSLLTQVLKRPYWCISRQRSWGVPIPVFYRRDNGEPIVDDAILERIVAMVNESGGIDFWWTKNVEEILPEGYGDKMDVVKGTDIFDIWFDSGTSWASVVGRDKIADLYLEGKDQCTGWFQTSLLTSCGIRDVAPYRSLFVHGFAVDENGYKMSKSLGNVIAPRELTKLYGTDALRWWVASHGTQHSQIEVSKKLLESSAESVQKIRSVLRYILGVVEKLDTQSEPKIDTNSLRFIDRALLYNLYKFDAQMTNLYQSYQFNHAAKSLVNYVTNDLSSGYLHLIKDRLYCGTDQEYAIIKGIFQFIHGTLSKQLYPIVPFLVEEVWSYCGNQQPFYKQTVASLKSFKHLESTSRIIKTVEKLVSLVNQQITGQNSWTLTAEIHCDKNTFEVLSELHPVSSEFHSNSELCEILQLSAVKISCHDETFNIIIHPIATNLCPRCRRFALEDDTATVCHRCDNVLNLK